MRHFSPVAVCALLLAVAGCEQPSPVAGTVDMTARAPLAKGAILDEYIVVLHDSISESSVDAIAASLASAHGGTLNAKFKKVLKGFELTISAAAADSLARDPRVMHVVQDEMIALAPTTERNPRTTGMQVTDWGVARVGGSHDGTGLTAWILDTGVDLNCTDLNIDLQRSTSFARGSTSADDKNGHGTHVAGIIGAKNNDIGSVGVAAGATIVAVKVLDNNGRGAVSQVLQGLDYIYRNAGPSDVVNMSLGDGSNFLLDWAVMRVASTGIKVAVAAGNDGANCLTVSPARVNHANVFTMSACDANDNFWINSNYGFGIVDYSAPGVDVVSTRKGGGTVAMSGTSMATPHVAGLLLLRSLRSDGRIAIGDTDGQPDAIAVY